MSLHFRRIRRGNLMKKGHSPGLWSWNAECSREWEEIILLIWKQLSLGMRVSCFQTLQGQQGSEPGALMGREWGEACRESGCWLCLGCPRGAGLLGKPTGVLRPAPGHPSVFSSGSLKAHGSLASINRLICLKETDSGARKKIHFWNSKSATASTEQIQGKAEGAQGIFTLRGVGGALSVPGG